MQSMYLLRCDSYYKIGVAIDVVDRVATLQTGNPRKIDIVFVYKFENSKLIESVLHQRFKDFRVSGEWFGISVNDIETIKNICEMLGGIKVNSSQITREIKRIGEVTEYSKDTKIMEENGYRIEICGGGRYWRWRERRRKGKTFYGGRIETMPERYLTKRAADERESARSKSNEK
mgnify:CR=1 FL=1